MPNTFHSRHKIKVEVVNQQDRLNPDESKIRDVLSSILADAGIQQGYMEIVMVDAPTIHRLNIEFLGHDYVTDVLAFEMDYDEKRHLLEGNVIVCTDTAIDRAPEFGWSPEEELFLYMVHGTLHLVGYDDHTKEGAFAMRAKEKEYLAKIGIDVKPSGESCI